MGTSQTEKDQSHDRIVGVAAGLIRERGLEQPSVAEVMREAGLTHGGFYKHFASRDALVAEASRRAMTENDARLAGVLDGAQDPLAAFADWYVSTAHRDDPAHGCGVAALGGDVARADDAVRAAYAAQVERYLELLRGLLGGEDEAARRRAAVTLSATVGAVVIARALGDTPASDALLADVRAAVREHRLAPGA